jgi:sarcosine oxidase subunit alpha
VTGLAASDGRLAGGGRNDAAREEVTFTFEGRSMTGYAGEPIAAALHANGVTVLSRSFKYRRPRGLHCMAGSCPNCSMRVDGVPGVMTCEELLHGGERVERERGWPSADRDALGVLDRLSRLTPNGFQYRWFRKSARLFEASEPVMRRLAARGALPDPEAAARLYGTGPLAPGTEPARITADVAVIGGGFAGMRAAVAAADGGASVALIERTPALGGAAADDPRSAEEVRALSERVDGCAGLDVYCETTAVAWYDPGVMLVSGRDRVRELRASGWIICTGAYPQPLAFGGNDLPGVMLSSAVRRLVFAHGVRPGRRIVIVTDADSGGELAEELMSRSVDVGAIVDIRPGAVARVVPGVPLLPGHTLVEAHGRSRVTAVTVAPNGNSSGTNLQCDVLCLDLAPRPATELLGQRLADGSITLERPSLDGAGGAGLTNGVWAAGAVMGTSSVREAGEQGDAAGAAAAQPAT